AFARGASGCLPGCHCSRRAVGRSARERCRGGRGATARRNDRCFRDDLSWVSNRQPDRGTDWHQLGGVEECVTTQLSRRCAAGSPGQVGRAGERDLDGFPLTARRPAFTYCFIERLAAWSGRGVTSMVCFGEAAYASYDLIVDLGLLITFAAPRQKHSCHAKS